MTDQMPIASDGVHRHAVPRHDQLPISSSKKEAIDDNFRSAREGGHRGVELGTSKFASQRNAHAGARRFSEFGRHVLGEINSFEHNRKVI